VAAVRAENLGLLFDVYHCRMNGEDPVAGLHEALPLVAHVQVADAPGRHEPGTGEIAWDALRGALAGYRGWVGCEYAPRAGTLRSLGWTAPDAR
jgi:hydroxypyruvate isomerase